MHVSIGVKEDIVRLDISVDNVLGVDIFESASKLGYPKPNGVFGKGLSGNVKSQITTAHQIDHEIPVV